MLSLFFLWSAEGYSSLEDKKVTSVTLIQIMIHPYIWHGYIIQTMKMSTINTNTNKYGTQIKILSAKIGGCSLDGQHGGLGCFNFTKRNRENNNSLK